MNSTSATTLVKRLLGPVQELPRTSASSITIRLAVPADADGIDRLAQLDSRRAPRGLVIVAEVAGDLWAAISVDDGHAVADPFRPTGELVALLTARSRQLRRSNARRQAHALPRVFPKAGYDHPAWS